MTPATLVQSFGRRVMNLSPVMNLRRRLYFGSPLVHERMLADSVRVGAYARAIAKYVKPGDVVVDAGTGTGVLAMLAARQGARVYAVDHSLKMIEYARRAAAANGVGSRITFVSGTFDNFQPPEPVDWIVQEQMGNWVFQERMVDTLLGLRRVLKPGGRILPGRIQFYLEPVELRPSDRVPFAEELETHGLKFPRIEASPGPGYFIRTIDPAAINHFLCEPSPAIDLDLNTLSKGDVPTRIELSKAVTRPGQLDGICTYFRAFFDGDLYLSTAPGDPKTCWQLPLRRVPIRRYEAGQTFRLSVEMPSLAEHDGWRWNIGAV